ncbi:XylR family transcriptional regulator [Pseudoduganella lutea]|nr:DNA-binding transcriptional regulator [Pseudoduganella lutea]
MSPIPRHRIALLFNANKGHERDVIAGVADYKRAQQLNWDLFVEDDFRRGLDGIAQWQGDGIIADFDDPDVAAALAGCRARVVGVGGSYANPADYPAGVPYVATDNERIIGLAHDHLIDAGISSFALYSVPPARNRRWALEREQAFARRMRADHLEPVIYRGHDGGIAGWERGLDELAGWLRSLPRPVGIIAVTDARARQLIQACAIAGLAVSHDVAIIGVDNDALAHALAPVPLSSVIQGAAEMGRTAARLLHRSLLGQPVGTTPVLVAPVGVNAQATCSRTGEHHPHITRALHFIRQRARRGIKSEQVADFVGVCRSGLDATFRRELGHSVHEEILRYKLEQAKQYLASGQWKIADVALECGFTSVQYLYTVFAREMGCTPREYQLKASAANMSFHPAMTRPLSAGPMAGRMAA